MAKPNIYDQDDDFQSDCQYIADDDEHPVWPPISINDANMDKIKHLLSVKCKITVRKFTEKTKISIESFHQEPQS